MSNLTANKYYKKDLVELLNNASHGQKQLIIAQRVQSFVFTFYQHNRKNPKKVYNKSLTTMFKELNPLFVNLDDEYQNLYLFHNEYEEEHKEDYETVIKPALNACWRTFLYAIARLKKYNLVYHRWDPTLGQYIWSIPYLDSQKMKETLWAFLKLFKCYKNYKKKLLEFLGLYQDDDLDSLFDWEDPPDDELAAATA
ncbi:hypothetical protein [[Mycoplasma] testudinis]|uniref:hypothetical protein n=1 Tax=[Mycoplasma] testudinis TaxID=33924 RepID=UPI000484B874|nr:hypothetical protein [[Mycoplasma] testudinis]